MSRADYCPIGNVPCQSLCETPCTARKPLTVAKLNECARDAQIDFCMNKETSFEVAFARRIEQCHGIAKATEGPAP